MYIFRCPRGPVQVHSIADAQRTTQNYRFNSWYFVTFVTYSQTTGLPFDESLVKSDKSVEDGEIVKLLKTSANPKAARKKKKAAEKAVTEVSAWHELSGGQTGLFRIQNRHQAWWRTDLTGCED